MTEKTAIILAKREFKRENVGYIEGRLREEINAAVQNGYRRFLIGFDFEMDRMAAEIVIEQKMCIRDSPLGVHHPQKHDPFDFPHQVAAELFFPLLVELLGSFGKHLDCLLYTSRCV